jgi:purine-binding chemotaxis protein CheW
MAGTTSLADDGFYVTLGIDREVFAVPVATVLEILDMRPVFRIPEAPAHLSGIIDVRGRAVPVIDLRTKLGLPSVAATETTRILVLEIPLSDRRLVLGLVADRVFEVATLDRGQIESAPDIGMKWRSDYIGGVSRTADNFVIILNLAQLFAKDEVVLLSANAVSPPSAAGGVTMSNSPAVQAG